MTQRKNSAPNAAYGGHAATTDHCSAALGKHSKHIKCTPHIYWPSLLPYNP